MNLNKTEIELIQYCLNHTLESRPWSYFRYYSKYTKKEDLKKLEELQKKVNKLQTKLRGKNENLYEQNIRAKKKK
jgi:DNA-directed RNA polymerase subunit L|tara:strand:+ start:290 stop:514 length:225 start_codon:yes stop_codon:yes gene_type:complete